MKKHDDEHTMIEARLSNQAQALPVFRVLELYRDALAMQNHGKEVCHLELGQPGGKAPKGVLEAAARFLQEDVIGYTETLGRWPLREAIAGWYQDYYGCKVSSSRIVVTMGSSAAFILAYLSCFNPGARIASPTPGYPCYRLVVDALGYKSLALQTSPQDRFRMGAKLLEEQTEVIDGLVLGNPANPTGTLLNEEELKQIATVCDARNIMMIVDEVYHGLTYGTRAATMAENENVIVINSFSKFFCMTGWRIGWMVVPEYLVSTVEKVAQNLFISASSLAQHAAQEAFSCLDELEEKRRIYQRNRDKICQALPDLGFSDVIHPEGALYVYASRGSPQWSSEDYCHALLKEKGVALTPGQDFDPMRGDAWVRISFCAAPETVDKALHAMRQFSLKNEL